MKGASSERNTQVLQAMPGALLRAGHAFHAHGQELYCVGGAVRDALMRRTPHDYDICGASEADAACDILTTECGARIYERSSAMGTAAVVFPDGTAAEYTPFRRESYSGGAHRPCAVSFGASLEEDALRRDFTVNSIYFALGEGVLTDVLGGCADIDARLIRTCDAPAVTLGSDGLRLMRLARFMARMGFDVEESTLCAAREMSPLISDIAPERVYAELCECLLMSDKGVCDALLCLVDIGVLERILCPAPPRSALPRLARVSALCPAELSLRFAALLYPLGAGGCAEALSRLRAPKALTRRAARAAGSMSLAPTLEEPQIRRALSTLTREGARDAVTLRGAAARVDGSAEDELFFMRFEAALRDMESSDAPFCVGELAIGGEDLEALGLRGAEIGKCLESLRLWCAEAPGRNIKQALMAYAAEAAERKNNEHCT